MPRHKLFLLEKNGSDKCMKLYLIFALAILVVVSITLFVVNQPNVTDSYISVQLMPFKCKMRVKKASAKCKRQGKHVTNVH